MSDSDQSDSWDEEITNTYQTIPSGDDEEESIEDNFDKEGEVVVEEEEIHFEQIKIFNQFKEFDIFNSETSIPKTLGLAGR